MVIYQHSQFRSIMDVQYAVLCVRCGCSSLPPDPLPDLTSDFKITLRISSSSAFVCCKLTLSEFTVFETYHVFILLLPPVAPPQPPAEDVDRYRRRFNMRMLVPGRPVKETPANPPPVPTERPAYREKFIPPELSMWDYFVAKVRH